jgi:hypothetical protein
MIRLAGDISHEIPALISYEASGRMEALDRQRKTSALSSAVMGLGFPGAIYVSLVALHPPSILPHQSSLQPARDLALSPCSFSLFIVLVFFVFFFSFLFFGFLFFTNTQVTLWL